MYHRDGPLPHWLDSLFAVVTLPLGILAFMFVGLQAAIAVFVVGWLLLVPAAAVLSPPSWTRWQEDGQAGAAPDEGEFEERIERAVKERVAGEIEAELGTGDGTNEGQNSAGEHDSAGGQEPTGDPIETLRERYASGEIGDAELERRLDALLGTEALDPEDEAAVRRTLDRLDAGGDPAAGNGPAEAEREPERE